MYRQNLIRFEREDAAKLEKVRKILTIPANPPLDDTDRRLFGGVCTSGDAVSHERVMAAIMVAQRVKQAVEADLREFGSKPIEPGPANGVIADPAVATRLILESREQQLKDVEAALDLLGDAQILLENHQEQAYHAIVMATTYIFEEIEDDARKVEMARLCADLNLRIRGEKMRNASFEKIILFLIDTAPSKYTERLEEVIYSLRQCMTRPVKNPEEQ